MMKKATCPNCGAEGTIGRYCEFCGTKIPAPIVKQTTNSRQENLLIVEDRLTAEYLIAGLPNALANQEDVSTDVFDDIEVKDVTKYIIPMYAYKGTFQAPWSCVKLVEETYKVGDEKRHRTKRYPMNGVASDSYAYLFPTCDLDNIPSELKSFILTEISNKGDITDYAESRFLTDSERDCVVEDNNDSESIVWRNFDGSSLIENEVSNAVHCQLPSNYEDFSYSYTTNGTKGTKVFIPIWLLNYTHKGKTYAFVIDGTLQNKVLEHPIDQEYVDKVKDWSDTSDSMSLYGILLAIVDAILGIVSLGCLISTMTRANIDSDGEVGFRLFWADILFFVFAFCLFKTKDLWHKSKLADSAVEITKIDHKQKVLVNFLSNIVEQNRLGLSAEELNAVTGLFKEAHKETSGRVDAMQPPKDIKTGVWIRPFVIVLFIIYVLVSIGFISGSIHRANLEKENKELAIKDSIKHEKAMQQQKEIRKKQNYRPSAPIPSHSDIVAVGLSNGIKQIHKTSQGDNTIYEFDKQGFLISVKKITSYSSNRYVIKYGKLISENGTEVEYVKVGANEDIISCDNYTLCNVIYDNKNRIVKIKKEYDSCSFVYDEGNNAHEVRHDIFGGTKTKEEISIPILDIIGCTIYIPHNWEDKIASSDQQGRPTEITYDGLLSKETIKIAYW